MDGVITNTMPDHCHAWRVVLKKRGIDVPAFEIYRREGQPGLSSVQEISKKYNGSINLAEAKKILLEKEEYFKKHVKMRYIVGTRKFLRDLHRKGFRLALVTGTARHELHRMLPDHIYNLFECIITGNDVKHGKPHPEPYLQALKKLKIKASESVVIENAPFGIESAKGAKISCLALETSLERKYLKAADRVFHTVKELNEKVKFELI